MNDIDVSVIIPVYNVERYLDQMLNSVFNQTLKNIEVIVVNDGSTDKSEEIILKYQKKYSNLIYIKQENSGVSVARNNALKRIKGKYTLFLDSDDYIEKNMIEQLYIKAERNSSEVTICGYNIFNEDSREKQDITFSVDENKVYTNKYVMEMIMTNKLVPFLWNKLFLSLNIKKYKLHFEENRFSQDWVPVFQQINYAEKICFINKSLYNYRVRGNSNSHKTSLKTILDHNYAIKSIIDYILKNNIELRKSKLITFIINHEAAGIKDYLYLDCIINNKVYSDIEILKLNIKDIIFNLEIPIIAKVKFLLYKLGILHKFYAICGIK